MVKQLPVNRDFVGELMFNGASVGTGRWSKITVDTPVTISAAANGGSAPHLSIHAVKALIRLLEGAQLDFVGRAGSNPALMITVPSTKGEDETIVYRIGSNEVVNTGLISQPQLAAALFAVKAMVGGNAALCAAYQAVLDGIASGTKQDELDQRLVTASDELMAALKQDASIAGISWSFMAKEGIPEQSERSALSLTPLFSNADTFREFVSGTKKGRGSYEVVRQRLAIAVVDSSSAETLPSADSFIGAQLDTAVRFMQAGRHILHHGPTGTGKSYVWQMAMKAVDPDFDYREYDYFADGSAGLEDIDLVGGYVIRPSGDREWVNGPLTRAMLDGKRFRMEEMNRMPQQQLSILLRAMDYGVINLIRYDGRAIEARPGFAVDAMVNIGQEYTGTEEIDAALLRRFQIKIEYDFLPENEEIVLLRSRLPKLDVADARVLVKIANSIRRSYEEGIGGAIVDMYVSPAALINSAALVVEGFSVGEAIELTWLIEVAKTKEKRQTVRDLIESHLKDRPRKTNKVP